MQGETVLGAAKKLDGDRFAVELDDRRLIANVIAAGTKRHVFLNGQTWVIGRDDPLHLVEAGGAHGGGLTAPMPGKVVALLAQPGQKVDKGAPLLILEAMKMEHDHGAEERHGEGLLLRCRRPGGRWCRTGGVRGGKC